MMIKSFPRVPNECHRLDSADSCMQVFIFDASTSLWTANLHLHGYFRENYEGVKGLICLCFQGAPGSFGSPGLSGEQVSNVHTRLGAWK